MQLCSTALLKNPRVVNVCESVNILSSYPQNTKSQAVSLFSPVHHFITPVSGMGPLVLCRTTVQLHYLCYFRSTANLVLNAAVGSRRKYQHYWTEWHKANKKLDIFYMYGAVALFGASRHPALCILRSVTIFTFVAQVQLHNILSIDCLVIICSWRSRTCYIRGKEVKLQMSLRWNYVVSVWLIDLFMMLDKWCWKWKNPLAQRAFFMMRFTVVIESPTGHQICR